jgi:hypothetical protein
MAVVRQTLSGPRYETGRPDIAVFEKPKGMKGPRIPSASENIDLPLEEAEREYDGGLPAWCPGCHEWRTVDIVELRGGRKRLKI